jgi:hypothetical protein
MAGSEDSVECIIFRSLWNAEEGDVDANTGDLPAAAVMAATDGVAVAATRWFATASPR